MPSIRRVVHRGLDELLMGAATLLPMHPPKVQMGPLTAHAEHPAGGVPDTHALAIPLPTRRTRLTFDSPVRGLPPPNDRVHLHVYPPRGHSRGVVVFAPFWLIPRPWVLAPWVRLVQSLSMHAMVYVPPDHMERTRPGWWSGERLLSFDFPYMERMLQLTAAELRAVSQGLAVHHKPVFLVGMSLGGLYAAMAALAGAPVNGLVLLTPAADMQPPMEKSRLGRHYRRRVEKRGDAIPAAAELRELGIPYRAHSFERPLPAERIFLAHGVHDGVVPLGVATGLARRWRVPLHIYPSGHMSLLFLERDLQRDVKSFLAACLAGAPASHRTARQGRRAARVRGGGVVQAVKAVAGGLRGAAGGRGAGLRGTGKAR
ncbi:MAG: hypothetical protein HY904_21410 [Deltaproteobacteria bacterium]|nr:hypothetical protein [Deltaproteobacteria bacterium]